MTMLSRKVDYALLILFPPPPPPGRGSAREIAARFALSRGVRSEHPQSPVPQGFVTRPPRRQGGYAFQRPAEAIRLAGPDGGPWTSRSTSSVQARSNEKTFVPYELLSNTKRHGRGPPGASATCYATSPWPELFRAPAPPPRG